MTTYKEPRIEIEQEFTAAVSNTYLPDLRGCVVAPFYNIVEEEDAGEYTGVEKEFEYLSSYVVDIRGDAGANELSYPVRVTLKESYDIVDTITANTGAMNGAVFTDATDPFTYPPTTGKTTWLSFTDGAYHHETGAVTLAADGAYIKFDGGTGAVPAGGTALIAAPTGAGIVVAVYDLNGVVATTTMPTEGYIKVTAPAGYVAYANDENISIAGPVVIGVANGASGLGYTLTSALPVFYDGLDESAEYVSTATLEQDINTETAPVVKVNTRYVAVIYAPVALALVTPGVVDDTYIDRADLVTSEMVLRKVRTFTDAGECNMLIYKTGVSYSAVDYEIYEVGETVIEQEDFTDWGITLNADGVTLPFNLTGPDGQEVTAADVYLTYRALRTDVASTFEYFESTSALAADFTVSKYNTGAYMLYLALNTAKGRPVYYTGVAATYLTDDVTAFSDALAYLEDKRVYALSIASMKPEVHAVMDAHVAKCSLPENHGWRIGLNTHVMAQYEEIIASSTTYNTPFDASHHNGFSGAYFCDEKQTFIDDGVVSGHDVYITGWTTVVPTEITTSATYGGGKLLTATDWGTNSTKIVLSDVTAEPVEIVNGMTVVIDSLNTKGASGGGPNGDTARYTDHTRTETISTGQLYKDLGYKIISHLYDSVANTLTLYVCTTGSALTASPFTGYAYGADALPKFYDGPLSLREETAIKDNYINIGTVVSNEVLDCIFKARWYGVYTGVTYEIRKEYTATEKAMAYAAYTSAYEDRRMNFVYPYEYEDSTGDVLPGYFIAAGEAGWIGGSFPHQSITSQTLQGYYRLLHSNKEFNRDQLNIIAGGGVTIFTQEVDNAGIACRHQLTTDMTSILTQENSITRSVDTAAYMLFDNLDPLKGKYNIVDDIFTVITSKINACRVLLCEKKYSRYGSILKTFVVKLLQQDSTAQDGIYLEMETETQKPFNRMRVLMKVK